MYRVKNIQPIPENNTVLLATSLQQWRIYAVDLTSESGRSIDLSAANSPEFNAELNAVYIKSRIER
jgi:hypothetical protein